MTEKTKFAQIVVGLPIHEVFTYSVPSDFQEQIKKGMRVRVSFGKRKMTGYVVDFIDEYSEKEVKPILEILDEKPAFDEKMLRLAKWVSDYYFSSWGEVLKAASPKEVTGQPRQERFIRPTADFNEEFIETLGRRAPSQAALLALLLKKGELSANEIRNNFKGASSLIKSLEDKGVIKVFQKAAASLPILETTEPREECFRLNSSQEKSLHSLIEAIDKGGFAPFLLYGVTGSGKTEVYLQAISHAMEKGKNALVLVPEISLTPQLVGRFRRRFGDCIALLHSGLSKRDRLAEWERARNKKARIVIGTRSAVFAPLQNLGIVVVDEEHDGSYKQEETPRYHARDVSLVRAKNEKTAIVLGSATPCLETFYNAKTGKYRYLHLPERIEKRGFPKVEVFDLKSDDDKKEMKYLSKVLEEAIRKKLARKEQVLLFLNRRGFAHFLMCRDCGHVFQCLNCSVSLTYHARQKKASCHYCGFSIHVPDQCPRCRGAKIQPFGMGTERIEEVLRNTYEGVSIARMDRDTTRKKDSHEAIYQKLKNREVDILIGTQMITKGHDFPNITLVGVISADGSLNIPDFRSAEKTFQLLHQVAGRAGRGDLEGEVIIQTFNPDHYSLECAKNNDYQGFYEKEIHFRKTLNYPPFSRLALIKMEGSRNEKVLRSINRLGELFRVLCKKTNGVEILGPAKGVPSKIKNRYRWIILLKAREVSLLHQTIRRGISELLKTDEQSRRLPIVIDIDPLRIF